MAYGAGAAGAGYMYQICDKLTEAVVTFVNSIHFNKDEVKGETKRRQLNLTQAYALLWQESKDGEVDGAMELRAGAVCAALVDLIVLDRVEIEIDQKSLLGIKYENSLLKVKDTTPTGITCLDDALFKQIKKHQDKSPEKPKKVQDYFEKEVCIWKDKSEKSCAYKALDDLVDQGILDKKKKFFGMKYPTIQPEKEAALVKEIRQVALENVSPDAYIRALLLIMRAVDNFYVLSDPLLRRHFSKEEYKLAKERIKDLVGLGKKKGDGK